MSTQIFPRRSKRFVRDPSSCRPPAEKDRLTTILLHLHRLRFANTPHLLALMPEYSEQTSNEFFKRAFHHGYIGRPKAQEPEHLHGKNLPLVHALGDRGASLLYNLKMIPYNPGRWDEKNNDVGLAFIHHDIFASDIMVAIELACRRASDIRFMPRDEVLARAPIKIQYSATPFDLPVTLEWRGNRIRKRIKQDGVFGLHFLEDDTEAFFFLQADCASEPHRRSQPVASNIYEKYLSYIKWHNNGRHRADFQMENFRVLFAAEGKQRTINLCEKARSLRDGRGWGGFLFAEKEALLSSDSVLEAKWINGRGVETSMLD